MKIRKQLANARDAARVILYTSALLSLAAKTRKDITTHGKHDEHSPCDCGKDCFGCLFED
jgi:hypothetical protein